MDAKSYPGAGFSLFLKRKKQNHLFKRIGVGRQLEESEEGVSCDVPPPQPCSNCALWLSPLYEVVIDVPISHMGRAGPQRHLSLAQVRIIKSVGRWDARSIPIKRMGCIGYTLQLVTPVCDAPFNRSFANESIFSCSNKLQEKSQSWKPQNLAEQGNARATLFTPNRKAALLIMTNWKIRFSWTKPLKLLCLALPARTSLHWNWCVLSLSFIVDTIWMKNPAKTFHWRIYNRLSKALAEGQQLMSAWACWHLPVHLAE